MFNIIRYFKKKSIFDDVEMIDYGHKKIYKISINSMSKEEALKSLKKLLGYYKEENYFNYLLKKNRFDKIKKIRNSY